MTLISEIYCFTVTENIQKPETKVLVGLVLSKHHNTCQVFS